MPRTFEFDESLPPLPVPSIQQTIEKYLDSCRALLSPEELKTTQRICDDFVKKDADKLQKLLQQRAKVHRNWLEQWWLDKAYLEGRAPLPYVNFGGPSEYQDVGWHAKDGTQIERLGYALYIFMHFWKSISEEVMPPHKALDGSTFTMQQFRFGFNTCRIPHRGKDEIYCGFRTKAEGGSPTHVVVICKGHLFKMETHNSKTGDMYTPPQMMAMLSEIKLRSADLPPSHGVCLLTCLDRDSWSDARCQLIDTSKQNQDNLKAIESAVVCICLDERAPNDFSELARNSLACEPEQVWWDKSFNYHATPNGVLLATCDHTPFDAMVLVMMVNFTTTWLEKNGTTWRGSQHIGYLDKVTELEFDVDDKTKSYIREGRKVLKKFSDDIELKFNFFNDFGKFALKPHKIHPDFFVQICIQLTYMKLHHQPAPTYETATTRKYYNGRTETCRTCTPEAVAFCNAFLSNSVNAALLLWQANKKFVRLMDECRDAHGCDRHLMGLAIVANENGLPLPEIFTDPAFTKTGGNGNFVLSTSCTGYLNIAGAVAPMVDNGYGCFYRINNDRFVYCVSAWKHDHETDADVFSTTVQQSFHEVFELLKENMKSNL